MFLNEHGHIHLISIVFVILLVLMFLPYLTGDRGIKLFEAPKYEGLKDMPSFDALAVTATPEEAMMIASGAVQIRYRLLKFQTELAKSAWYGLDDSTRQKILSGNLKELENSKQLFTTLMDNPTKFNIEDYEAVLSNIKNSR